MPVYKYQGIPAVTRTHLYILYVYFMSQMTSTYTSKDTELSNKFSQPFPTNKNAD